MDVGHDRSVDSQLEQAALDLAQGPGILDGGGRDADDFAAAAWSAAAVSAPPRPSRCPPPSRPLRSRPQSLTRRGRPAAGWISSGMNSSPVNLTFDLRSGRSPAAPAQAVEITIDHEGQDDQGQRQPGARRPQVHLDARRISPSKAAPTTVRSSWSRLDQEHPGRLLQQQPSPPRFNLQRGHGERLCQPCSHRDEPRPRLGNMTGR